MVKRMLSLRKAKLSMGSIQKFMQCELSKLQLKSVQPIVIFFFMCIWLKVFLNALQVIHVRTFPACSIYIGYDNLVATLFGQ